MPLGCDITVWGEGRLAAPIDWWRVLQRLNLNLPGSLPQPRGEATVTIALRAILDAAASRFQLCFTATAAPDAGLRFGSLEIGAPVRLGLACDFATADQASAALESWNAGASLDVHGTLTAEFPFRLPTPPEWDILRVRTGDGEGWITLRLEMSFASGPGPAEVSVTASVRDPFNAELFMPGASGGATWLEADISSIDGTLLLAGETISGSLAIAGAFAAHLRQSWLVTPRLAALGPLFSLLERSVPEHAALTGTLAGALDFSHQSARLGFRCTSPDVGAEVNLHDLLGFVRDTVRGQPVPPAPEPPPAAPAPDIGLKLRAITFELSEEPLAAFELEGQLASVTLPIVAAISYKKIGGLELAFGLGRDVVGSSTATGNPGERNEESLVRIPLLIPHIRRSELEPLADVYRRALRGAGLRRYNAIVDAYFTAIERAFDLLSAGEPSLIARREGDGWRIEPQPNATVSSSELPVVFAAGRTEDTHELAVGYNRGEGWRPLLIKPAVQFERVAVHLPVQNLRDIRVSGTVRFTCEGPLKDVSRLPVTLGLSVDMIYASVDTEGGVSIEIPPLLPGYDSGRIVIGQCRLGLGYTKRSFAFSFAGELVLPSQLVDDLDTSDRGGAGIRLPEKSNLALRFDLIPFVLGKAVIPLPSFQFNWDLRRSAAAATIRNRETCEPGWDGLQIVVPGLCRAGLERISFSPLLGGVVSYWNSDFAADVQVGDASNGYTFCLDNSMWAYAGDPSIWTIPFIPILGIPFFDDACVALRVGGFSLGFDLQRPLPTFSPFALFELLALVSDPLNYQVAPRGKLADTIRATLANGRLTLPAVVYSLFSQAGSLPAPRREMTVNLADYIRLLQIIGRTLAPIVRGAMELARNRQLTAQRLKTAAAGLSRANLAATALSVAESVPPALRRFDLAADLAGFRGSAQVAFTSRQELLRARLSLDKPPKAAPKVTPAMIWNADVMRGFQPRLRDRQPLVPFLGARAAWFGSGALAAITAEDLREIPAPDPPQKYTADDVSDAFITWLMGDRGALAVYLRKFLPPRSSRSRDVARGLGDFAPVSTVRPTPAVVARALNQALDDEKFFVKKRFAKLPRWLRQRADALPKKPKKSERRVLHRLLLEFARPDLGAVDQGLICAATLGVFGVRLRMLGWVRGSGEFLLISYGEAASPLLAIAGVPGVLPWQIVGRARLHGQVGAGGVAGSIRVAGHAAAELVPGALKITLGSAKEPIGVEVWSTRRFTASGDGTVALFDGTAVLAGQMQLSDQRIGAHGTLTFLGLTAIDAWFSLEQGVAVLTAHLRSPDPAGIGLGVDVRCHVQGRLSPEHLLLEGAAALSLEALAFTLNGGCRWEQLVGGGPTLTVEGDATWQGLGSMRGAVTLGSQSLAVRVSGRAGHTLSGLLQRTEVSAELDQIVPRMFGDLLFQIEFEAGLSFDAGGTMSGHVSGSWLLALVPSGGAQHCHAVLTNRFSADVSEGAPVRLVDLAGLRPVPLPQLSLPVLPVQSAGQARLMECTISTRVGATTTPHVEWGNHVIPPYPLEVVPGSRSFSDPPLAVVPGPMSAPARDVFLEPLSFPLQLDLAWQRNRLGLLLRAPSVFTNPQFVPIGPD